MQHLVKSTVLIMLISVSALGMDNPEFPEANEVPTDSHEKQSYYIEHNSYKIHICYEEKVIKVISGNIAHGSKIHFTASMQIGNMFNYKKGILILDGKRFQIDID